MSQKLDQCSHDSEITGEHTGMNIPETVDVDKEEEIGKGNSEVEL